MTYHEYEISDDLKPYVTSIWSMEADGTADNILPVRILPDTCVELVIHFKHPYVTTFPDHVPQLQPHSFIVGQMKRPFVMQPAGDLGILAARFSAVGAYRFFSFPLREIADQFVDLQSLSNPYLIEVADQILTQKEMIKRVQVFQKTLRDLLYRNGRDDSSVDYCISLIRASKGLTCVRDLAKFTGISERQLLRKFDECLGLSPKEFSRIVRLHQALLSLQPHSPEKPLTDIAQECGYYDQSHFIHDFYAFTGLTPREFLNPPTPVFF